ncbi:hypothetical protein GGS23DRAFT_605918 [Durotheca rogersii]|uniref:uncharacterized protein n=1 Tax=Durotheca rogersii TaxID=419775 RepID=UPI00221ED093|nr:uncharacterized protein GGS23DRAFT_605918 [Durotheca rogersii]KAI5861999.1 hypothetical protein GGS23DRAFT_605918 [Durotheca rogersii]
MVANKTLVFKKIPTSQPVPGEHLAIEEREIDLAAVPAGGLVVEVLSVSLDPYLRFRLRDPAEPSIQPAFAVGAAVENDAVARVLASDDARFRAGDVVGAPLPVAQFAAVSAAQLGRVAVLANPHALPAEYFLGPLGMPGLTAFSSLYEIGRPRAGETLFVSSAAGAVGSMVGQLAKREGMTVIGSVGSDAKAAFVTRELGFDAAFNYKREAPAAALARLAPGGIDVYYENVGGAHLEAALAHLKTHGRVVVSGMIQDYNRPLEQRAGVRNLVEFLFKRLSMRGFFVSDPDFGPAYAARHQRDVQAWLADGSLRARLHVTTGIDRAAEAFVELFEGKNFGKAVLRIKEE